MKELEKIWKTHSILFSGMIFGTFSLLLNLLSIIFLDMAHIYDIVHIFPVLLLFYILDFELSISLFLLPLAVGIDILIGFIIGKILSKIKPIKNDFKYFTLTIIISFLVYFIAICFQWIPII